ncbi:MAG: SCO family protein [Acidobacteriota bacterium]
MIAALLALAIAAQGAQPARLQIGLDEHVGARIPAGLVFTDTTGKRVALGELFDGKRPIVLVMAYAKCTMLCSVVLHGIAEAARKSGPALDRDYLPVVVSLDPRETWNEGARRQNTLLSEIGRSGARGAWPYLVGDAAPVAALARALGFRYAWDEHTQQYAHPAVVFVLTPDGRIGEYLQGVTYDTLPEAVARAARGELTPALTHELLECFHFDPSLRRYEAKISLFLKLGGAVVLVTLVALIALLTAWERRRRRR